ncbi:MAG: ligase-associated DNA damage response exonuclease [Pyrinomonadaceae bacterium]|nr:ligase-associated DNA damage response exonuclease [Phycisphaerales bacterium]
MPSLPSFIELTPSGPFCRPGGFYVDPWRPVEKAVITHAHSDHATRGCGTYLASTTCGPLLRARLGSDISLTTLRFGEQLAVGDVLVSLHPAGHVLGSAQIRIEYRGEVIVFSGDYKLDADPTAERFEPVKCHTFISESTFGLPIFQWQHPVEVFARINDWWRGNQRDGRTSVLFVYSLGKAQRVLASLDPSIGPIGVHGSVHNMNKAYVEAGVGLPASVHANEITAKELRGAGMILTPQTAGESPWLRRFAGPDGLSLGNVSGWMQVRGARRRQALDRGFPVSDHADWAGLNAAIAATGAQRIGVTHGSTEVMTRWLREKGVDAFVVPTRYVGETGEASEPDEATAPSGDAPAKEPGAAFDDTGEPLTNQSDDAVSETRAGGES